jgi:hypothetical protein
VSGAAPAHTQHGMNLYFVVLQRNWVHPLATWKNQG